MATERGPVRLVALDIDSTILDRTGKLSPRTIKAVAAARAAGINIVLATGRRHAYALPVAQQLGFAPDDLIISSTGTVHRTVAGRLLERTYLPRATALDIVRQLEASRETLVFTFDEEADGPCNSPRVSLLVENYKAIARIVPRWVEFNGPYITERRPIESGLQGEEPIQAMALGSVEQIRAVERSLAAHALSCQLSIQRTEYLDRDLSFIDLLPAGCGKGQSLSRVAAALGIPRSQTAAVGDNNNDLDMLRWAGRAFAVANASTTVCEHARRQGWQMIGSNDDCGPAELLLQLAEEHALMPAKR